MSHYHGRSPHFFEHARATGDLRLEYLTSPVNAPHFSWKTFWAATWIPLHFDSAAATDKYGSGGATTNWTLSSSYTRQRRFTLGNESALAMHPK